VLSVCFCAATLAGFALGLKGMERGKIVEMIKGTAMAVLVLALVGSILWKIVRFLEADSDRHPHQGDAPDASGADHSRH
jgi:predicted lipid-binding transport protein (Tim44 family)